MHTHTYAILYIDMSAQLQAFMAHETLPLLTPYVPTSLSTLPTHLPTNLPH